MSEEEVEQSTAGSLMSHLVELRDRVVRMMVAILTIFACLFYWANDIYIFLAEPLTQHLPEGSQMIAIDVASPFLTPFKLVLMLSVFLAMPVILHQCWSFVAPGLYANEKRIAGPLLVSSILLFYAGVAFAYFIVFPLVFGFFTSVGPETINISTDIGRYLDFVLALFFGFGLAFEVPIATIILVAIGFTTPKKLGEKRPYIIVGAFITGMLLTPPDIISQVLLALPMWILFEAGLIAAKIIFSDRNFDDDEDEEEDDEDEDAVKSSAPVTTATEPTATEPTATEPTATENADDDGSLTDAEMNAELDQAEADEDRNDKS